MNLCPNLKITPNEWLSQRLKYADLENYIIECGIKSKSTFDNHKATLLKLFRFSIQRQYIESSDHLSINHNDFKHNFEKVERDDISPNEFKVIGDNFENWIISFQRSI